MSTRISKLEDLGVDPRIAFLPSDADGLPGMGTIGLPHHPCVCITISNIFFEVGGLSTPDSRGEGRNLQLKGQ